VARFTVAVDVWRRQGETYASQPTVFHRVVCFGSTAENVNNSLRKGMEVVAIGEWIDDSYTDELGNRKIQIVLDAKTVGPTLRRAIAQVVKTERRDDQLTLPAPNLPAAGRSPADPAPAAEPVAVGGG
jgi:single-strand DNA-binding protein